MPPIQTPFAEAVLYLTITDTVHFGRRLRVGGEWRGEEDQGQHHDEPNGLEWHGHLLLLPAALRDTQGHIMLL